MSEKPLVSVIIPTYNRAKTIYRAIESCLCQTYSEIEILIIDDNSSDETVHIVKNFKDSRVKYLLHSNNMGPGAARNTGLRNATGEFISFLDSDDEWLKDKVSKQVEIFEALSNQSLNIGLVFVNGYNEAEKCIFIRDISSGIVYSPRRDNFYPLNVLVPPPTAWMITRKIADDIGLFDERMYNWDDGDYWARIAYQYDIYFLNENLVIWHASREHVNRMSSNLIAGKELFLKKNYDFMKKDKEYLFRFYKALGKDALSINKAKSRKYLLKALSMKPYDLSILSKLFRSFRKK
ncbi:MAG: glycosyltransferase family 2 protein [Candidatus Omnitrophota bacterium]|jgi:glycosyltransferase involved in cell wall biosynthesis